MVLLPRPFAWEALLLRATCLRRKKKNSEQTLNDQPKMQRAGALVEEITLAILKPDFIRRGGNQSWIAGELSKHKLRIVAQKDLSVWPRRDGS